MTQAAAPPAEPKLTKPRASRWRRWTAGFLIVLSCILAPLSVVSVWVRNQVLDTNRYVANVAPLASNPAIINTAAVDITTALFDNVDVEAKAKDALPEKAQFLAAPLATALQTAVNRVAVRILESDQFQQLWKDANRRAHAQLTKALTGEGRSIGPNNKVVLNLSAIAERVRLALKERGIGIFDRIPADTVAINFQLVDAKQMDNARSAVKLLNKLSWALPILSLLCLGGGLALSSSRRRTLIRWGIGVAFAVALIGAGLAVGRSIYLDAVTSPTLPSDTAAAVFDTLVRFLRYGVRLIIAIGLVVAFAAWLTGPGRGATSIRTTAKRAVGGAGAAGSKGMTFGGFGAWVARDRAGLRIAAALLALVVLLLWDHPRGGTVLLLAVLLLIVLGVIEFVGRAAVVSDADPVPMSPPAS